MVSLKKMDKDKTYTKRRVIAGSIEPCVHNLGTERFVEWLEDLEVKYVAIKLGPAHPIQIPAPISVWIP